MLWLSAVIKILDQMLEVKRSHIAALRGQLRILPLEVTDTQTSGPCIPQAQDEVYEN